MTEKAQSADYPVAPESVGIVHDTTQEIADKLFISFGTVETHRRNMLIKTGTRNTAGLVKVALEYALLT